MPDYTADASTLFEQLYSAPSWDAFVRNIASGIPIAGNYVPTTPELEIYRRNHPEIAGANSAAGALAATAPLAYALPTNFLVQSLLGAGINAADAATSNEDHSPEEIARRTAYGAALGGGGAAATNLGRLVQPPRNNAAASLPTNLFSTSWRDLNGPHAYGAAAGVAGEIAAGAPYLGLAGIAAPYAAQGIGRATRNLTAEQQALINSLTQGTNATLNRE